MQTVTPPQFQTLAVRMEQHVAWVALNRPEKANAMNSPMWDEIQQCFEWVDDEPCVRAVVLCGEGKNFCAGIDLGMLQEITAEKSAIADPARQAEWFRRRIMKLQDNLTAIERCRKPVMAAIQGNCVGGAVDLVSACDMRYCCEGATFSIKEADIGLVADVGTLQRLPKIMSPGMVRELAYTARNVDASEAERIGLVNRCYSSYEAMIDEVSALAQAIARKSPLVIRGTKEMLNYTRDHSVEDGLRYVATWNGGTLSQHDVITAMSAAGGGESPDFQN